MKVTAITQPQSSCPFKSARQKIFDLGYSLLVFVYDKKDDPKTSMSWFSVKWNPWADGLAELGCCSLLGFIALVL